MTIAQTVKHRPVEWSDITGMSTRDGYTMDLLHYPSTGHYTVYVYDQES